MTEKHRDRLIHVLLREELGAERPPDLTDRIMRQLPRRQTMIWQRPWAWAALVAMCLAVLGAWAWRRRYPDPAAGGGYRVEGGGPVTRAAVLYTADRPAELEMGGYCVVRLAPESRLRIDGRKRAEAVHLMQGEVQCDVNRKAGEFKVTTDVGTVRVTGTKFMVRVKNNRGEHDMRNATKTLILVVAVTTGTVNVEYNGKVHQLSAGMQQAFGGDLTHYDSGKGLDWNAVHGFSGMVRGTVERVGDGGIKYRIARVLKTWKGNKAKKPQSLVGHVLHVRPRHADHKTGTGAPVKRHLAYMHTLRRGQEVSLEIYNPRGKEWHILELNADQRRAADRFIEKHHREDGDRRHPEEGNRREGDREEGDRRHPEEGHRREGDREEGNRRHPEEGDRRHPEEGNRREGDREEGDRRHPEEGHRREGDREEGDRRHPEEGHRREGDREEGDRRHPEEGHRREGDREEGEHGGHEGAEGRLPASLHGFRGMMEGTIVKKGRDHFLFKVEKVTRVWKENKARHPESAAGKFVVIDFHKKSRLYRRNRTRYRKLRIGDKISVEPFHLGGDRLSVVEELKLIR